jgi:hypothetical protein
MDVMGCTCNKHEELNGGLRWEMFLEEIGCEDVNWSILALLL